MKCTTVIDSEREEEVLIFVRKENALTDEIKALVEGWSTTLMGYTDSAAVRLQASDIFCVTIDGGRVYATTARERLQLKERLYVLEELLGRDFVKINQSCMVNVKEIDRFEASIGGALLVTLKNGYKDYVSRRQVKAVKERLGL